MIGSMRPVLLRLLSFLFPAASLSTFAFAAAIVRTGCDPCPKPPLLHEPFKEVHGGADVLEPLPERHERHVAAYRRRALVGCPRSATGQRRAPGCCRSRAAPPPFRATAFGSVVLPWKVRRCPARAQVRYGIRSSSSRSPEGLAGQPAIGQHVITAVIVCEDEHERRHVPRRAQVEAREAGTALQV